MTDTTMNADVNLETPPDPAPPADMPLRDSKGWDGKMRLSPSDTAPVAQVANPEALLDPDYSDDENVLPGEMLEADEGTCCLTAADILTADFIDRRLFWLLTF
jgi:hypothetical protein